MKDYLEDIIIKHKHRLDNIECVPEDRLWIAIEHELNQKQYNNQPFWLKAVAAIILVLLTTIIFTNLNNPKNTTNNTAHISQYFPESKRDFENLNHQILAQKVALSFDEINPSIFPDIFRELAILDENFKIAITDLNSLGNQDAILKVLIKHHQRQLALLERLANEIEKNNVYETRNNKIHIY